MRFLSKYKGLSLEENQAVKVKEKEPYEVLDNNIGLMNPSVLTDDEIFRCYAKK